MERITTWIKQNKVLSGAIALAVIGGIVLAVKKSSPTPKNLSGVHRKTSLRSKPKKSRIQLLGLPK